MSLELPTVEVPTRGKTSRTHSIAYVMIPASWRDGFLKDGEGWANGAKVAILLECLSRGAAKVVYESNFREIATKVAGEYAAYIKAAKDE